jgi:hypothetical protein
VFNNNQEFTMDRTSSEIISSGGLVKMRLLLFILAFLVLTSSLIFSQDSHKHSNRKDVDYMLALGSANQFLTAWQWRRQEDGLKLLSDSLKQRKSEEDLRLYLSGSSNPHHEAFEICSGKRLDKHRYSFKIQLFEAITGQEIWSDQCARSAIIVMVKEGQDKWVVDELP